MSEASVIKEFLVALGYKVDESAMKKFTHGIATATKAVENLGFRVEATALAVAYGVARFASNLEQLYFAAQRTNSSADGLKAFDLAARNFGASIDEAQGSVEGLAAFLRNNPGGANVVAGWLGTVGLSARDANGQLLQGTALMAQLGKMFAIQKKQNQWPLAHMIAGELGISDKTALAMSDPGFEAENARQQKRAAGWNAVSAAAHRFMDQLEDLKLQFFQLMLGFEGPAMAALQGAMTKISKLMHDHGKQIVKDLSEAFTLVIQGIGQLLDWLDRNGKEMMVRIEAVFLDFKFNYEFYIKPTLEWLWQQFIKLDEVTSGWSTKLLAVSVALKALGATGIVTGVLGIGAGLAKGLAGLAGVGAGVGAGGAAAAGAEWSVAGALFGTAAAGALGIGLGLVLDHFFPDATSKAGAKINDAIEYANQAYKNSKAADPGDFYASHWPWQHPSGATYAADNPSRQGGPVTFKTDITILGANMGKEELAQEIAKQQQQINSRNIREWLGTVQ